ncbi:hypothetical protein KM043_003401 [Ampulex compressa]|nr:hypothetical protein KM043_003401 [Ampulex compressa]
MTLAARRQESQRNYPKQPSNPKPPGGNIPRVDRTSIVQRRNGGKETLYRWPKGRPNFQRAGAFDVGHRLLFFQSGHSAFRETNAERRGGKGRDLDYRRSLNEAGSIFLNAEGAQDLQK